MLTMPKPGPKPKDPSQVRSVPVALKTTHAQAKLWRRAAKRAGRNISLNEWANRVLTEAAEKLLNP